MPIAYSVGGAVAGAQPGPRFTLKRPPGTVLATVNDGATPPTIAAWSSVRLPAIGAASLSNQKLNSMFQRSELPAGAVHVSSVPVFAKVQSFAAFTGTSTSWKPTLVTIALGQDGMRNTPTPPLLSRLWSAYS